MMLVAGKGNNIIYYQDIKTFFLIPEGVFLPFRAMVRTECNNEM